MEVAEMVITAAGAATGGGGGAYMALRVHIDHIRGRQNRHHKAITTIFNRVTENTRRIAKLEGKDQA